MKKLIMMLAAAFAAAMPLKAETEYANGYTWTYERDWRYGGVSIGEGSWSSYGESSVVSPEPTGNVIIPSRLGGKPVTRIGFGAFYGYSGVTSVTIPNSVKGIEEYAFDRCTGLTSVNIPDSVTDISGSAFCGCDGLADGDGFVVVCGVLFGYVGSESEITIPNGVTFIGESAFKNYNGLRSVTIPDSVTRIGVEAFYHCRNLERVLIGRGVKAVGRNAFLGCSDMLYDTETISGVTMVDGLAINGSSSLSGNLDLTRCRGVGSYAFAYCYDITSVTIPADMQVISYGAFAVDGRLSAVHITDLDAWLRRESFYPLSIAGHLFLNGTEVTSIVIPEGVTTMQLFSGWSGLKSVTLPNSIRSIDEDAFYYCNGLTSVVIPNSVTNIGSYAFEGCKNLKSLVIPASVKYIGSHAFAECDNLQSITLPKWCQKIRAYYDRDAESYELTNKIVNNRDWYPVNFLFYAFVDDDYYEEGYLNYKKIAQQETRGMKIIYKDVGVSSGGDVAEIWKKARTLRGAATRALPSPYDVQGVIDLKCGKANKKGVAKVSATLTRLDGKKRSYGAQSVDVTGKTVTVNFDGLIVTIEGDSFEGGEDRAGGLGVRSTDVGGSWSKDGAKVYVDATGTSLPEGTQEALWPDGETVLAKSGKWAFNKAATVKLSKDKTTAEWDTSKGKSNLSGLKLTYTPNTGLFKGSFKVYALEEASNGKKLKKYTANVTGVVVNGQGYGQATIKKPAAGPWAVTVE